VTDPCTPTIIVVSRAARLAWRLRHPLGRAVHPHGPAAVTPARLLGRCEGLVAPDGSRVLPALPGGKTAAIAAGLAAAAGAAFTAGAALAGAGAGFAGGSGGSGSGASGSGAGESGTGGTPGASAGPPSVTALAGVNGPFSPSFYNTPGTLVPDRIHVTTADTAQAIPAPSTTALLGFAALLTIALHRRGLHRAS